MRVLVLSAALLLVATSGVNAVAGETDGLVALWKFDEVSGPAVKDSSAYQNDGMIIGEVNRGRADFAGSVSLSGTNRDHVRVPASASLNTLTKHVTVIAHVYPRSLWTPKPSRWAFWADQPTGSGYIAVVQRQWKEEMHPDLFYLGYGRSDNSLYYKWHLGVTGRDDAILYCWPPGWKAPPHGWWLVPAAWQPSSWHQPAVREWVDLAGTYDADTGRMSLYVNGEQICTRVVRGEIRMDSQSATRPLVIGAEVNGPDVDKTENEFDGYIEEVRLYDRVLSDREIRTLADAAQRRSSR